MSVHQLTESHMRILWYALTALFGLIGVLALLGTVEKLATGAGLSPGQLVIAIGMLLLAVLCVQKAPCCKLVDVIKPYVGWLTRTRG